MKHNNVTLKQVFIKLTVFAVIIFTFAGCTGTKQDDTSNNNNNNGGGGGDNKTTGSAACINDFSSFVNNNINSSSVVTAQGGALYDKWWDAAGLSSHPTNNHPMWSDQTTNTAATGEDTWRCKECHGWDYKGRDGAYGVGSSHYTNFPGIWDARNDTPINVFCAIHSGTGIDSRHVFKEDITDGGLSSLAILQLTKFITYSQNELPSEPTPQGLIDARLVINYSSKAAIGDSTNGGSLYANTGFGCSSSNCHGSDGAVQEEQPLGAMANDNPWEMLHKIRFGHAGVVTMPAFSDTRYPNSLTLQQTADIIAYAQQSLSGTGGGTAGPTDVAMIALGGRLYDHWIEETNASVPLVDNPIWAIQTTNIRTGADTWRCKECHGWDYAGAAGAYGPASDHYTGFGGVLNAATDPTVTEDDLVSFLTEGRVISQLPSGPSQVHGFGQLLTDTEIRALAKFIKMGVEDTTDYIYPSGVIWGTTSDLAHGEELYMSKPFGQPNGNCELCHGLDGKRQVPVIVGAVAVENPWETLHKIRFGQPNSSMPSLIEAVNAATLEPVFTIKDAADIVFFAQSLPQQ